MSSTHNDPTPDKCAHPTTCCKQLSQCYCINVRAAFPCDNDVPCMVASCGLVCCVNWGLHVGCCQVQ